MALRPTAPIGARGAAGNFGAYWEIARPFTLLAPALGMLSGAVTAWGARPRGHLAITSDAAWAKDVLVGCLGAALLNAASNVLNQICDLRVDRINQPERVLPSGRLGLASAAAFSVGLYGAALALAASVNGAVLTMFVLATLATVAYSVPPIRTKRFGWWANATIAVPRGVLLKVAGWSVTKPVLAPEAWIIGAIFGLFLLGATTSKDFADVEGDRGDGCRTLVVVHGRRGAIQRIRPFFIAPFLLLAAAAAAHLLSGNRPMLIALGLGSGAWGGRIVSRMAREPGADGRDHDPSWRQMYYLMFTLQVGFMAAYLVGDRI